MNPEELQRGLLNIKEPQILIAGDVGKRMYDNVATALLYLTTKESPPVTVLIDSLGGGTKYGYAIYNMIRLYKGKTIGLVTRTTHSAATIILQGCTEKHATPQAEILVHYVLKDYGAVTREDFTNAKRRKKVVTTFDTHNKLIVDIFRKHTKMSISQIKALLKKDEILSAKEALQLGLITKIV